MRSFVIKHEEKHHKIWARFLEGEGIKEVENAVAYKPDISAGGKALVEMLVEPARKLVTTLLGVTQLGRRELA